MGEQYMAWVQWWVDYRSANSALFATAICVAIFVTWFARRKS